MASTKLTVRQLVRSLFTPIPEVARVVKASDTTSTYTPPPNEYLIPWMNKLPSHVHLSPQLPGQLCDSLVNFLSAQEEIPFPQDAATYQQYFDNCAGQLQNLSVGRETDVDSRYPGTIDYIVIQTCRMYGLRVDYASGPEVFNLLPNFGHRELPSNKELTVFEHKNPTCARARFPHMVNLARNNTRFELDRGSSDAQSIIDKLALSLATKNLEFGAVHCLTQYQIMRLVTKAGHRPIALLSEPIAINDDRTPILPVIVSLLLRSKFVLPPLPDSDIPENLWESVSESDESSLPDPSGPGMAGRGRGRGSGRGGGGGRGGEWTRVGGKRGDQIEAADCEGYDPTQHGISYWIRDGEELFSGAELAARLESVTVIPYFFDMKEEIYANNVAYAERIPSSNIWIDIDSISTSSGSSLSFSPHSSVDGGIVNIPPSQVSKMPPLSPPAKEIALRINEELAHGENSWVVKGMFGSPTLPSSSPVIVKKFDTWEDCEQELSIYRQLAPLAGESIPGVYGAYKVTGEQGDFGMLWLEDVGNKGLEEDEGQDVREMVYDIALKIHQLGVKHGDLHEQNMVVANGSGGPQVRIIDFHYGSFHKCPGEESCSELQNLKSRLNV